MNFTGERLLSSIGGKIALEHLHRYAFAYSFVKGKSVLDIACGEGYGSHLLATVAANVTGVDISNEAVAYAQNKYSRGNLKYIQGSATAIPLADHSVDVVVSFETIEHLAEHQQMMNEIKRVLSPVGTLIISSPDKEFYTDATGHNNEFHVKELYAHEFETLIKKNFKNSQFYFQGFTIASLLYKREPSVLTAFSGDFQNVQKSEHPGYQYNLAVCSDSDDTSFSAGSSVFTNTDLYNKLEEYFDEKLKAVYNSKSYRLGNFFVRQYNRLLFRRQR